MKLGRESDIQERMGDVTCLLSGQGDKVTASQTHGLIYLGLHAMQLSVC